MEVSCEFAVENNPDKQKFILEAHQDDIRHLFGDVQCFGGDEAFCLREGTTVPIPKVFLLIASPSCVNLSGQRVDRANFADCYEADSGDCESSVTYEMGYKAAAAKTEAKVRSPSKNKILTTFFWHILASNRTY